MPLPILQPPKNAADRDSRKYRIFVSYSHRDAEDALRFMDYLRLKLRGLAATGIGEEHVYFDRQKLLAGDEWDDSIQRALEEADYLVFLVSVASLSSKYCVDRELAIAVTRGVLSLTSIRHPRRRHCPLLAAATCGSI